MIISTGKVLILSRSSISCNNLLLFNTSTLQLVKSVVSQLKGSLSDI